MRRKALETVIVALVLISALAFVIYAFNESTVGTVEGYELEARFNRVDGLVPGTDVRMSGIKIGSVVDYRLDQQTYLAIVRINIKESVRIPTDSSARILADGLLGDNYLSIEPGANDEMLEPGAEIVRTQDPINIADLLGRFAFGQQDDEGSGDGLQ